MKVFLIIILILLIAALLYAGYYVFYSILDRKAYKTPAEKTPEEKAKEKESIDGPNDLMRPTARKLYDFRRDYIRQFREMPMEKVSVTSFDGLTLNGKLYEGDPKEVVICVHGYHSSIEEDFADKAQIYFDRGCTTLFVTDRGHGDSGGRYTGFSELDRFDVSSWVDFINERYEDPKIYLHGVSMGGATVVHCADMKLKNVKGIIADCPFSSIRAITRALMTTSYHIPYFPVGYIAGFWSKLIAGIGFDTSIGEKCVANSDLPIVFIHGKEDNFVPCSMSESMAKAAKGPVRTLYVEGCGHAAAYMMAKEEYTKLVNDLLDGNIT